MNRHEFGWVKIVPTSAKIKRGLNIPLAGQPQQIIDSGRAVKQVALLGPDYIGLNPKMLVRAGQVVSLGELLLFGQERSDCCLSVNAEEAAAMLLQGPPVVVFGPTIHPNVAAEKTFRLPQIVAGGES